jgi:hypothetical protein
MEQQNKNPPSDADRAGEINMSEALVEAATMAKKNQSAFEQAKKIEQQNNLDYSYWSSSNMFALRTKNGELVRELKFFPGDGNRVYENGRYMLTKRWT